MGWAQYESRLGYIQLLYIQESKGMAYGGQGSKAASEPELNS